MRASALALAVLATAATSFTLAPAAPRRGPHAVRAVKEWRDSCADPARRPLPCMPFGLDELLLPGSSRYLHLYEARFLNLFEASVGNHSSVLGAVFMGSGGRLIRVGTLLEVDDYKRLQVGIGVTVRAVGRFAIEDVDPASEDLAYLRVLAADFDDAADASAAAAELGKALGGDAALGDAALGEKVLVAIEAIEELSKASGIGDDVDEIRVDPRGFEELLGDDDGADSALEDLGPMRSRLRVAASTKARRLISGPTLAAEEVDLLSFLALEGASVQNKLDALMSQTPKQRLGDALLVLEERRSRLAAKASIKKALGGGGEVAEGGGE